MLAELQSRTGGLLPTEDGRPRPLPGWAAEASGDSASAGGRMLRVAAALESGLPTVARAVRDGQLPWVRAEVLTRLGGRIAPAALSEAEAGLIVIAQVMDPQQLASYVRHLLATWVGPVVDDAEAAASARRYLKTRTQADGSVRGSFLLPAGDAEVVLTGLEPLARNQGDADTRSAAQRRADALLEVFEQVLRFGQLPDTGGFRPQLNYVLPADWAARRAEAEDCRDCSRCPAHQPVSFTDLVSAGIPAARHASGTGTRGGSGSGGGSGGGSGSGGSESGPAPRVLPATHACAVAAWTGPQTRVRIEAMLCDVRITRVLLDSTGQVTGLESLTDSVTNAQRRALAARDQGCAARGCTRPPAFCDAHHLVARADGGASALGNLVLLCRRHHVLWHLGKIDLRDLNVPWRTYGVEPAPPRPAPPPPRARQVAQPLELVASHPD